LPSANIALENPCDLHSDIPHFRRSEGLSSTSSFSL
jgi:hypothetical protein